MPAAKRKPVKPHRSTNPRSLSETSGELSVSLQFPPFDDGGSQRRLALLHLYFLDGTTAQYITEQPCYPDGTNYVAPAIFSDLEPGDYYLDVAKSNADDPMYGVRTLRSYYFENPEGVTIPTIPTSDSVITIQAGQTTEISFVLP